MILGWIAALRDALSPHPESLTEPLQEKRQLRAGVALVSGVVFVAAVVLAAATFADYAAAPSRLWQDVHHDRNGHFGFALDLALALRDLDFADFFAQLEKAKTWPPLHGLVLAAAMLAGGIDLRLAILPSVAGWAATIVLVWLISLRLFTNERSGLTAGAFAVVFAAASPSFRLITADVMLEGLGAALSAVCLYAYLRANETPAEARWWRILAIALTLLFFEKSNYWVLTAVPLLVASAIERRRAMLGAARASLRMIASARGLARDPLVIAFIVVLAATIAIAVHGPWSIRLLGKDVSLYPPHNLLTAAWWLLFARLSLAWKQNRAALEAAIGLPGRQLAYWHVAPVAVSFLLPRRLGVFLWFIGPTHHHGRPYDPLRAALEQWAGFAEGFHVHPWAAAATMAGALFALGSLRRLSPSVRAVACVALFGAAAVLLHPQQQLRFQTTILYAWWILAGAGWSLLFTLAFSLWPRLQTGLAAAAVLLLVVVQAMQPWRDFAYTVAIHPRAGPSDTEVSRAYLTHVGLAQPIGVLSTTGGSPFYRWTARERCKCRVRVDQPALPVAAARQDAQALTAAWLMRTPAVTLVALDMPGWSAHPFTGLDAMRGQMDALTAQSRFRKLKEIKAPIGNETISIWVRQEKAAGRAPVPVWSSR